MNKNKLIFGYWVPFFFWAMLIFYLSSLSNPYAVVPENVRGVFSFSSLVWHVLEYAVFYMLLWRALKYTGFQNSAGYSFLFTFLYSILDEMHQLLVYGRDFSVGDIGLDILGALFGMAVIILLDTKAFK